jgi:hypothetical protein
MGLTCTGINTAAALTAALAAYATSQCTFTRTVPGNTDLTALTVTAAVTGTSTPTFSASTTASFPAVPVHSGLSRLQVSSAVTSLDVANYVDGKWTSRFGCPQ